MMGKRTVENTKKSIAVIGEGLTEYRYIDNLRTTERYRFKLLPGMPKHSDIDDMVSLAKKYLSENYDYVLCLVDMDVIHKSEEKKRHYASLKRNNPKIEFIESSPCTEYWFLMHFMTNVSSKEYETYGDLVKDLRKYIPDYDKTEAFFNKTNIYKRLKESGDLARACNLSYKLEKLKLQDANKYKSFSLMYKLFVRLEEIAK